MGSFFVGIRFLSFFVERKVRRLERGSSPEFHGSRGDVRPFGGPDSLTGTSSLARTSHLEFRGSLPSACTSRLEPGLPIWEFRESPPGASMCSVDPGQHQQRAFSQISVMEHIAPENRGECPCCGLKGPSK